MVSRRKSLVPIVTAAGIAAAIAGVTAVPQSSFASSRSGTAHHRSWKTSSSTSSSATSTGSVTSSSTTSTSTTTTTTATTSSSSLTAAGSSSSSSTTTSSSSSTTSSATGSWLPAGTWHQAFGDEFNGSALDTAKWGLLYPWGSATNQGNNESECYVPGALAETGGTLVITATKASVSCGSAGTKTYTSGLIQSHPSFNFTYGYMEMRAKLPGGDAEWPAFWSLPADYSWPPEIDVMEGWGQNHDSAGNLDQIRTTYHWSGGQYGQAVNGVDFSSQWHVFGADWEPGSITWYLDGKQVMQYTGSTVASAPEYVLANLAIDGSSVDSGTPNVAQMAIDYIRVWQHG